MQTTECLISWTGAKVRLLQWPENWRWEVITVKGCVNVHLDACVCGRFSWAHLPLDVRCCTRLVLSARVGAERWKDPRCAAECTAADCLMHFSSIALIRPLLQRTSSKMWRSACSWSGWLIFCNMPFIHNKYPKKYCIYLTLTTLCTAFQRTLNANSGVTMNLLEALTAFWRQSMVNVSRCGLIRQTSRCKDNRKDFPQGIAGLSQSIRSAWHTYSIDFLFPHWN